MLVPPHRSAHISASVTVIKAATACQTGICGPIDDSVRIEKSGFEVML
jgi:hypothetical protein